MDVDVDVDGVDTEYRDARLAVRVAAWGRCKDDADRAVMKAATGPARAGWNFADVRQVYGVPCPFDPRDPHPDALAADSADGWAYEVFKCEAVQGG